MATCRTGNPNRANGAIARVAASSIAVVRVVNVTIAASATDSNSTPHTTKVAEITWDQVREIAETKKEDLNANDIDAAAKIIAGTARSMGITVK